MTRNLTTNLTQLLSIEDVANLHISDDIIYILKREYGSREVEASFVVETLRFRNLPSVEGTVWIGVKIFISPENIEESEINSIILEIRGPIDDPMIRMDFERRFQALIACVKTALIKLIGDVSAE